MSGMTSLNEMMELEKAMNPDDESDKIAQQGDHLVDEAGKPPVTHDYGFTWQQTHSDN